MSTVQCLKKSSLHICEKFNGRKLLKVLKVVKPVLKLMRKQRTNAVTPSACNYDIVESFQNDLNESELFQLDFKFFDGNEIDENLKNEELEKRLLEKLEDEPTLPESSYAWTPDFDICKRGDEYMTCRQTAERQMAAVAVA